MFKIYKCVLCGVTASPDWYKCCNKHTTIFGNDVICEPCLHLRHTDKEVENATKVL